MQSRYPQHIKFDYCLNPLHLIDGDKDVVVPCGKCDGCRVHAANIWSQRLGQEIEDCPDPIFVTPTYNNKFLPKLVCIDDLSGIKLWVSNHRKNWRFSGNRCSLRDDDIQLRGNYEPIPVSNFDDYSCIPYASKRDMQLYLKRLRQNLVNLGIKPNEKRNYFRYFIISEYGETRYRPHFHCIFFPATSEISRCMSPDLLYQNWQMCDKDRFVEFVEHCNSSTSNYLTTYVNCLTNIPKVYRNNEVRPFRLASKSPAIGFGSYIREEIFEEIVEGTFEYVKRIERLTDRYVVRRSKNYFVALFPKCKGYVGKSFDELLFTYGLLYRDYFRGVKEFGDEDEYFSSANRLSANLCASDFNAARKCFKVCSEVGCTPFHYVYLLDKVWYLNDMYALHMFYTFQNKSKDYMLNMSLYSNLGDWLEKFKVGNLTQRQLMMLDLFFEGFGIDSLDIKNYSPKDFLCSSQPSSDYLSELSDILQNMVKMPKLNESLGVSPTNQFT